MKRISMLVTSAALALGCASAFANQSSPFPNLEAASQLIDQSTSKIQAARQANHDDFGGHAERAQQLLRQARAELDAAAHFRESHR
ncbi:hypothetical protein V4C53_43540 [Paraburkholderia azotifigens]|uniref:hypothetical protein n=1 Tax=Paraburkholderia azotifigens TaxID=2057004 RepID=UPI00316B232F